MNENGYVMSNEIKLMIEITIILLQFYIGAVALLTPENLHLGHYVVVVFVSIPTIVSLVRERLK